MTQPKPETKTETKTEAKRPNPPINGETQASTTSQHNSDKGAIATRARRTELANAARVSLNNQVEALQNLTEGYMEASAPIVDQASDVFASCISGEWFWGQTMEATKAKLAAAPKPQAVDFTPALDPSQFGLRSLALPQGTTTRYLESSPTWEGNEKSSK